MMADHILQSLNQIFKKRKKAVYQMMFILIQQVCSYSKLQTKRVFFGEEGRNFKEMREMRGDGQIFQEMILF